MGAIGAQRPEMGHLSGDAARLSGALPQPIGDPGLGRKQSAITRAGVYLLSRSR